MCRQLKISNYLLDSLIEDNIEIVKSVVGSSLYDDSIEKIAQFLSGIEDTLPDKYNPIEYEYRFYDKEVDEESYCESCFGEVFRELTGKTLEEHSSECDSDEYDEEEDVFSYFYEPVNYIEAETFSCCDKCGEIFDFSYILTDQELDHWEEPDTTIDLNDPRDVWMLKELFSTGICTGWSRNQEVIDKEHAKFNTSLHNIALKIFDAYKKLKQSKTF